MMHCIILLLLSSSIYIRASVTVQTPYSCYSILLIMSTRIEVSGSHTHDRRDSTFLSRFYNFIPTSISSLFASSFSSSLSSPVSGDVPNNTANNKERLRILTTENEQIVSDDVIFEELQQGAGEIDYYYKWETMIHSSYQ